MGNFEGLGLFYLGRRLEADGAARGSELLLYDSKDLTTHAVCVGMTGSGKTGLCLSLLEEAALDGIPALAIDPKGDLGNLLLSFPELQPADFRPWVDESDAARQGVSADELARRTAATWKQGLESWGQDGARIERLRNAADFAIYTPGSGAGLPLAVLKSFQPPPGVLEDADALRERIGASVAGLLALLGLDADPVKSRESMLLSSILQESWRRGAGLDLPSLIRRVQDPPFDRIGVMPLETFYPAKERLALGMSLNGLLASPGFSAWMEGEPLDVARLLWTGSGRPRISILSIAHLSDAERMFFVTLLLNEVIAWMRSQPGTSSLRAILYMDEVFGYFPPTANPPSKLPLLTLMKQARAFGLGVVLATQNPVDLDYKGLSNAGTWILGRLQTERDKARVLDGLEGASAAAGARFDRRKMEATLAGLKQRIFVLNNVHEEEPVVFESRWCMSYLRGPLTRAQIQILMAPRKSQARGTDAPGSQAGRLPEGPRPVGSPAEPPPAGDRPVLPPGIPESFLPCRGATPQPRHLLYRPAILGSARLHYSQVKSGVDVWEEAWLLAPLDSPGTDDLWEKARVLESAPELEDAPVAGASFSLLPEPAAQVKSYESWKVALAGALYRSRTLTLLSCAPLEELSRPGESEGDFRARLALRLREKRDLEVEALRARHAVRLVSLQERIRRAEQRLAVEQSQYDAQKVQTAISAGAAILGALFGRKALGAGSLGRATTAARGAGRAAREREDAGRAAENVEVLRRDLSDLQARVESEVEALRSNFDSASLRLEPLELRPKKSDIQVGKVVLVWAPYEMGPADGFTRRI